MLINAQPINAQFTNPSHLAPFFALRNASETGQTSPSPAALMTGGVLTRGTL
jgi:hypothetical protein